MKTYHLFALLLVVFACDCPAQAPAPADSAPAPEMKMQAWLFPDVYNENKNRDWIDEPSIIPTTTIQRSGDFSNYLKGQGIPFPPGSEARYLEIEHLLIVRNTAQNIAAIDAYVKKHGYDAPASPSIELTAVECILPPEKSPSASHRITYTELAKLPAKSIKLLDRVSASGPFDEWTVANHIINPAATPATSQATKQEGDFAPGESGTIMSFATSLGDDRLALKTNVTYRFRKLNPPGDASAIDINFKTFFASSDDEPAVLNVSAVPDSPGKFIVVIGRTWLFHPDWSGRASDKAGDDSPAPPGR